jgi:UPF0755 protein
MEISMNNGNNMNDENLRVNRDDNEIILEQRRRRNAASSGDAPRRTANEPVRRSDHTPTAAELLKETEARASAGQYRRRTDAAQKQTQRTANPAGAPVSAAASRADGAASRGKAERAKAAAESRNDSAERANAASSSPRPSKESETPSETRHSESAARRTSSSDKVKNEKKKDNTPLLVSLLRSIVYIVVIVVIAAFISVFVINIGNDVFAFVKSDDVIEVEIPDDPDVGDIADVLYENGIIKYPSVFKLYAKVKSKDSGFLTDNDGSVFYVSPSMNYDQLLSSFKEQVDNSRSWITIPEGYTVDEIIDLMLSYGIGGSKEDYVDVINNGEFDYWFVQELEDTGWSGDRYYRLEGYLFPDTYEFYNSSSAYTVVNKLLKRFDEVYVDDYKTQAEKLGLTTDQVVILASIIEKEAGNASDYRNVSSVLHNRLNNPTMYPYLESDATIMYAIQHDTGERPKTLEGTDYESPYNTYKNKGYPPGPIANPSASALRFAISPADTNYYYFYSGSGGYTYFASTYAEHQRNIELAGSGIIEDNGQE